MPRNDRATAPASCTPGRQPGRWLVAGKQAAQHAGPQHPPTLMMHQMPRMGQPRRWLASRPAPQAAAVKHMVCRGQAAGGREGGCGGQGRGNGARGKTAEAEPDAGEETRRATGRLCTGSRHDACAVLADHCPPAPRPAPCPPPAPHLPHPPGLLAAQQHAVHHRRGGVQRHEHSNQRHHLRQRPGVGGGGRRRGVVGWGRVGVGEPGPGRPGVDTRGSRCGAGGDEHDGSCSQAAPPPPPPPPPPTPPPSRPEAVPACPCVTPRTHRRHLGDDGGVAGEDGGQGVLARQQAPHDDHPGAHRQPQRAAEHSGGRPAVALSQVEGHQALQGGRGQGRGGGERAAGATHVRRTLVLLAAAPVNGRASRHAGLTCASAQSGAPPPANQQQPVSSVPGGPPASQCPGWCRPGCSGPRSGAGSRGLRARGR